MWATWEEFKFDDGKTGDELHQPFLHCIERFLLDPKSQLNANKWISSEEFVLWTFSLCKARPILLSLNQSALSCQLSGLSCDVVLKTNRANFPNPFQNSKAISIVWLVNLAKSNFQFGWNMVFSLEFHTTPSLPTNSEGWRLANDMPN